MKNVTKCEKKISRAIQRGYLAINDIEEKLQNVETIQRDVLNSIISRNAYTRYGREHRFTEIGSFENYCEMVPFSDWDDYREYVDEMLSGRDEQALFSDELFWYANTAGTTGRNKSIPLTKKSVEYFIDAYVYRGIAMADRENVKRRGCHLQKGHVFIAFGGIEYSTENHKPYGTVISAALKLAQEDMEMLCIPPGTQLLQSGNGTGIGVSYYMFLRYGLLQKDIVYISSIYDRYLIEMFSYLSVNWKDLCDDIEKGIVGEWTGIPMEKRNRFQKEFHPDPVRATEIRKILTEGFDPTSIQKIWPELVLVSAAKKVDVLEDAVDLKFYLGDIAYDDSPYGSSECLMAVRLDVNEELTLIPDACVYEFIPEGEILNETTKTKKLWELEVGRTYEVMITTYSGLYRYRIKDVLEVVGKNGDCPMIRFLSRKGVTINLFEEKTTEKALRDSITVGAALRRIPLSGYSVYGEMQVLDTNGKEQGCYVVQFETKEELKEQDKELLSKEIDKQLCNMNESYRRCRNNGKLKPLQVEELPVGTYQRYDELHKKDNGMDIQYKRPLSLKM